jgi:cold shock CspA family protein
MLFIDGTWLYSNLPRLAQVYRKPDFHVDFAKLPQVLAGELGHQLGSDDVQVVRTHLFGSHASNYDLRDDDSVQRRLDFFAMLKEEYHYEVETFPINFRGRRLRREDRDPADPFEPKEKCVDISLATAMMYYAAIPFAYDIAVAVIGDRDFKPLLEHVRRLGKRVAIASIRNSCAPEFADPRDEARVRDFDMVWLDDMLPRLELKYDPHQLECQSPTHRGERLVWTTFHPRRGQKFYCDACRAEFARQKNEAQQQLVSSELDAIPVGDDLTLPVGQTLIGKVKRKLSDRGYGFLQTVDGKDYYYHFTDLAPDVDYDALLENQIVEFEVKKEPSGTKAGAAQNVRRHLMEDMPGTA